MRLAVCVDHVVPQHGLALEAESPEDRLRGGLVQHHARGQQLQLEQLGDGVDLFGQHPSQAATSGVRREQQSNLAQVAGPVGGGVVQVALAEQLVAVEAEHRKGALFDDFLHPAVDRRALGDVAAQEQQVVGRQRAGEVEDQVLVAGRHQSQGDAVAIPQRR